MRIGEIAKRTGLNISNIRFYERKGLLHPEREDNSQYRDYTEDNVLRIKRILLYRKMGIPIETIYLLLNGQVDFSDVLERQQNVIWEEINNLNGSLHLCQMLFAEENLDMSETQMDAYLNYVYQEEEKGVRFAVVEELVEDISEFTGDVVFPGDPVWHGGVRWISKALSLVLWGVLIICPVIHVVEVINGKRSLSIPLLLIYGFIIAVYSYGFVRFRKTKKRRNPAGSKTHWTNRHIMI